MNIVWSSAADFFAMGGYGFYVWGSFGMTALAIAAEIWALKRARQDLRGPQDTEDDHTPPDTKD